MAPKPQLMLSEAIAKHLAMRRGRGDAPKTITRCASVMGQFLTYNGDMKMGSIDVSHLEDWRTSRGMHLKATDDSPLAPKTLNAEKNTIEIFFDWAISNRLYGKANPAANLRPVKGLSRQFLRLPAEKWGEFLDAASCPRDRALFAVGFFSFCRASEIKTLKIGDLTVMPDGSPGLQITRWKTKERDLIPITLDFKEELDRWIKFYKKSLLNQGITLSPEHMLIPAYRQGNSNRVHGADGTFQSVKNFNPTKSPSRLELLVQPALTRLGHSIKREGMHTLRRSGALAFYQNLLLRVTEGEVLPDSPIRIVMSLCGHKNQSTTEIYLGLEPTRTARNLVMTGRRMIEAPAVPVVSLPVQVAEASGAATRPRWLHAV